MQADTARVIWSYHSSDPLSESAFPRHEAQGSISLNLLAGLPEDRAEPDDTMKFPITVGNVNYFYINGVELIYIACVSL